MAGAEEDAVPPHLNTVKLDLGHILTGLSECLYGVLFIQVILGSQCMGEKERAGFYCDKSITMLQSMIIDWDVKWPHAGSVTADTAANHSVKTKEWKEWRSEGGLVKIALMVHIKKK